MKFLKFILPVLVIFQIAVFAQSFKKSNVLTFAETNCKKFGKNPLVTVCIESATQDAQYTKRLGGAFKSAVEELISGASEEEKFLNLVTPEEYGGCTPCTIGDWLPCCGNICEAYPSAPGCPPIKEESTSFEL